MSPGCVETKPVLNFSTVCLLAQCCATRRATKLKQLCKNILLTWVLQIHCCLCNVTEHHVYGRTFLTCEHLLCRGSMTLLPYILSTTVDDIKVCIAYFHVSGTFWWQMPANEPQEVCELCISIYLVFIIPYCIAITHYTEMINSQSAHMTTVHL